MVISVLFFTSLASAINFDFSSPESVKPNQNFSVKIIPNGSFKGVYDVKIFVNKPTKEYSEIYTESGWKSTANYLREVFPGQAEFILIAHIPAKTNVCVRLRDSSNDKINEICKSILVTTNVSPTSNQIPNSNISTQYPNNSSPLTGKITLNPEKAPNTQNTVTTTQEQIRKWIPYVFGFICLLIIIFLVLRKL
ncbi:MAG: hypothetical protein Q7S74_01410 [Nanoarchaeota archaeon]|nr:hypothetical protein [Nanoarchaeota archaeon]